jgi:hypothetical protein
MNDTSPRAAAIVQKLLDAQTPAECVEMMGGMFQAARAFMTSALLREGIIEGTVEWKFAVLDRTYGAESSPQHRQSLIDHWPRKRE